MFLVALACLFAYGQIVIKLSGNVDNNTRKRCLDFLTVVI